MLAACADVDDELIEEMVEMEVHEQDWTGLCYTAALRWVREHPSCELVHGTVLSDLGRKRIKHAWCELNDAVADLAVPAENKFFRRIPFKLSYPAVDASCVFPEEFLFAFFRLFRDSFKNTRFLRENDDSLKGMVFDTHPAIGLSVNRPTPNN